MSSKIRTNYHTHTDRCKHAVGRTEDYVQEALRLGMTELGMSDHTPLPDDFTIEIRMEQEKLSGYIAEIEQVKERYQDRGLHIYRGMECDYLKRYEHYYKDYLREELSFEYLIGSVHAYPLAGDYCYMDGKEMTKEMYLAYADTYVAGIESGLFDFMGHPDVFGQNFHEWNEGAAYVAKEILSAAAAHSIPLELNMSGVKKSQDRGRAEWVYPRRQFWEMASDEKIMVILNSDAHAPEYLLQDFDKGEKLIRELNLNRVELHQIIHRV